MPSTLAIQKATGFRVTEIKGDKWKNFTKQEYDLRPAEDDDVDIAVDACGVCASDVHTINGGWNPDIPLPLCVGHEVIGRVLHVGSKVKDIKVGDRVGVGAQIGADLNCRRCEAGQENYCPNQVDAYGAEYRKGGAVTQGGYASHIRAHQYFTFKIPDGLDTVQAAPMLCAGLTVYAPIKRLGAGPGKHIGVVGLGGLGHFAVLWAKALGADVTVISHSPHKEADAREMGASFISTAAAGWEQDHAFKFDFIICTADATHKFDLPAYFTTLNTHGLFHMVGFPDHPLPSFMAQAFAGNGSGMSASHIGNHQEMVEMLQLAADQKVRSWVQEIKISEAGCREAVEKVYHGGENGPRYRFTLTGYDEAFGKREPVYKEPRAE